eukprot:scaffold35966_cov56-Phaeocystis_antarctica.AAC.3
MRALATTATAPSGETTVGLARPKAAKLPTSPTIRPTRATQNSGWRDAGCRSSTGRASAHAMTRLPLTARMTPTCIGPKTPAKTLCAVGTGMRSVGGTGTMRAAVGLRARRLCGALCEAVRLLGGAVCEAVRRLRVALRWRCARRCVRAGSATQQWSAVPAHARAHAPTRRWPHP